jgi:hypothetical protein
MKKEIKQQQEKNIEFIKSKLKNVQLEFPFVLDLPGEKYNQKERDRVFMMFEEFVSQKNLS